MSSPTPSDHRRLIGIGVAVVFVYVLTARLGFQVAYVAEQITTVWAPTGIAQAALLLWGRRLWPAVWLGAFLANAGTTAPLWTSVAVATGNTLEAVAAAWILSRVPGFDLTLRRIRDAVAFIIVAALATPVVSATIGVSTFCAAGVQPWARFFVLWSDWWLGDALGALVVAPVLLTLVRQPVGWGRRQWLETAAIVGAAALVTQAIFGQLLGPDVGHHPLEYAIFPFVVAAAVRLGQPATALVILVTSTLTILDTVRGGGPFAASEMHQSLILLQAFMGVLSGTGLLLAAAILEREHGERRRAAAHSVSDLLAGAPDLASAAPAILRAICETLEWSIAALWLVEPGSRRLRCVALWNDPAASSTPFTTETRERIFTPGVGLPGRVLATAQAAWIADVVRDENFPRASAASQARVHGAFAFPLCAGDEVVGVIECFTPRIAMLDADLLSTMSTVGNQIGQFMLRKRVEEAVLDAERQREDLLVRESAARREAEAANRAKDDFLAMLSHELRTPLNAIVGWTRMLLDGSLDEATTRRALQVIDRNAHLQAQLVADILDVSRIITGGLRMDVQPVDLITVIGAAVDAVSHAAEAKGITLRSRLASSARLVRGDPQRLQQIVWNLLSNAVKFTPPGGLVEVELADDPAGVAIRVHDNGLGIDPLFLPHVFERFRQADGSATRQHGGLGLGLAIVRHLVELHGGSVRANSDGVGHGATFLVTLPSLPADDGSAPTEPSADAQSQFDKGVTLRGCRALVVEDDEDARELIAAILQRAGAIVETAASAEDALGRLEASCPDVLLADIAMPVMDGYGLIREVRRRDALSGSHLPAAAITAHASDPDRLRALAEGFDRHVAKPINPDAIVATVLSIYKRPERA